MPNRFCQIMIGIVASLQVAQADPLDDYRHLQNRAEAVAALAPELAQATDTSLLSDPLLTDLMPAPTGQISQTAQAKMGPAELQLIDLRIALVQLSIYAGTNDQLSVVRAQAADAPQVIAIRNGSAHLSDIRDWIADQPAPESMLSGDGLRIPLVVLEGARLILSDGDALELSRVDGTFLLNLGTLIIDGAQISVGGPENQTVPEYAPFVVTAGSGIAQISDAHITGLGFSKTAAFSGLAVVNKGLYQPIGQSFLTDSILHGVGAATFLGADDPVIQGNIVIGGTNAGLVLNRTEQAHVQGNLITQTQSGSALRITDVATGSRVTGNLIFDNENTGIQVTRGSRDTALQDNILWRNGGVGLSIQRSDCTYATGNVAMDNRKKGIELQSSWHAELTENMVFGNRSSGLLVADQPNGNETLVARNVFAGNRVGLASASAHILTLRENDFSNQFPRLVEGDLLSEAHQIMTDLTGTDEIQLVAGGIEVFGGSSAACSFERDG
ncbi:MAG: right-handed parallel beta-helix repeat-containing protein [Pseudomonadota bacterium]